MPLVWFVVRGLWVTVEVGVSVGLMLLAADTRYSSNYA